MEWTNTLITWGIPLLLIGYFVLIFNRLVALKNRFKNAFSQIDVQLQRRHDLIPSLVETAKAYMAHERETLEGVMAARNKAASAQKTAAADPAKAGAVKNLGLAEGMLNGALAQFYAVQENYPDLKADQTMRDLMESLESTENKVSFSRQAYNDSVMVYQTYKESFPNSIIAAATSFKDADLFEVEDVAVKSAPKVSF